MKRSARIILGLWLVNSTAGAVNPFAGYGVRIKDLALIEGARPNQLRGLGLVTGLKDTGDRSEDSAAHLMVKNLLRSFGLIPNEALQDLSENTAAVMVFAEIPPFVKPGARLDVQVAAIGGSESLQGGVLIQTPLHGADGQVYAVAQGPLTTGSFSFRGEAAQVIRGSSTTVGLISQGAIVEAEIPVTMLRNQYLYLNLKQPDFTTAARVAEAINAEPLFREGFPAQPAAALDAATIRVEVPENYRDEAALVRLITQIEGMYVEPDQVARIVVNERTGTIVIGQHVRISTVAVAHGGLSVVITETPVASQPEPFSETGETQVLPRTGIGVEEESARTHMIPGGVTVSELANALNALGASPRDIIAILQAIKTSGALQAELTIL